VARICRGPVDLLSGDLPDAAALEREPPTTAVSVADAVRAAPAAPTLRRRVSRRHAGAERAVSPEATLRRIRPLMAPAGITRLADVTGLDRVGIPVYQAIRPGSRNLSVSQGKGLSRTIHTR
jgi:hypothetical protein